MSSPVRVRVAGPAPEARRLALRLSRAGIPAAPDDGDTAAEVIVALGDQDLGSARARAKRLVAVGLPSTPLFQAGADEVVPPGEPQVLFRCVRGLIERADLEAREARLAARLQAMDEALAEVAHDLRSPLHTAIGHAELLAKDPKLTGEQRSSAEASARQANRALQLAEHILEGAGRHGDTPQYRMVHLGQLVESAAAAVAAAAQARGVSVVASQPEPAVSLRADAGQLARVLENLLANAIRHTPAGGRVEVAAERVSPRSVRLRVTDEGEGIPPKLLPKLVSGMGGGRGLRIARQIAERHGGELWGESAPGKGTTFTVELALGVPSLRTRVLLISDDGKWIKEVAKAIKGSCDVSHLSTANAQLNGGRHPDLVLVEAPAKGKMPALTTLRTQAKDAKVPVIDLPPDIDAAHLARTLTRLTG